MWTRVAGQDKGASVFAHKVMSFLHSAEQESNLLAVGNRLIEEAGLHGGPLGNAVSDFGHQLCTLGFQGIVRDQPRENK